MSKKRLKGKVISDKNKNTITNNTFENHSS